MLVASLLPIEVAGFRLLVELPESEDPWVKNRVTKATFSQRLKRFLASSTRRIFPNMPIPLRLPFGAWWLAENSAVDEELLYNGFEQAEMGFVKKLLRVERQSGLGGYWKRVRKEK